MPQLLLPGNSPQLPRGRPDIQKKSIPRLPEMDLVTSILVRQASLWNFDNPALFRGGLADEVLHPTACSCKEKEFLHSLASS
jgi:hypothetical protein